MLLHNYKYIIMAFIITGLRYDAAQARRVCALENSSFQTYQVLSLLLGGGGGGGGWGGGGGGGWGGGG